MEWETRGNEQGGKRKEGERGSRQTCEEGKRTDETKGCCCSPPTHGYWSCAVSMMNTPSHPRSTHSTHAAHTQQIRSTRKSYALLATLTQHSRNTHATLTQHYAVLSQNTHLTQNSLLYITESHKSFILLSFLYPRLEWS